MPWLLILALAAIGVYVLQGKEATTHYKIKFIDALFDSAGTRDSYYTKFKFVIRVEVTNPTDFAGKLNSAKLGVIHNKKLLGSVTIDKPVEIPKQGKTIVPIPVAIPIASLLSAETELISILKGGKSAVLVFNLVGKLNFSIGTLDIKEKYQVKLK